MTPKPDFLDNRAGRSLAAGLNAQIEHLLATRTEPPAIWIASSYFKPEGFPLVAEALRGAREVRLLLGAEPPPRPRQQQLGETSAEYQAHLVDEGLRALQDGLEADRDLLGFSPETDRMLSELVAFLRSEPVEVRLYRPRFLHGKAYLFPPGEGVIVGSSNFTAGGLQSNLELNLGRYDPEPVGKVEAWFGDLWAEAEPLDLAAIYEARFEPFDPYLVYLRVLLELYGAEEAEEAEPGIPLTDFQRDGLVRARRILRDYHGAVVADGVGLGKTFIAGELLKDAIYQQRQRALLIAPAALRDGTWSSFLDHYQIHCERLSFDELANEPALGGGGTGKLRHEPHEYELIVIDEAQALRNPETRRARALRELLAGDPPKQLVLLSATPVNNSLWDLYYLLSYFIRHDAVFADRGIFSLQKRFAEAAKVDPFELRPDVLFDVLDAVCVRRTRHFVRKWYPTAAFLDHQGNRVPVRFPRPSVLRVDYGFDEVLPGFFDELEQALMPKEGLPKLTLARYSPSRYRWDRSRPIEADELPEDLAEPHERQLVGLLRSALLKRFESSVHAFARTTERMAQAHDRFLRALDAGYVARAEVLADLEDVDSDGALEQLLSERGEDPSDGYDVVSLRRDAEHDRDLLYRYHEFTAAVAPEADPKLTALVDELVKIAHQAAREGLDAADQRNRRKVVLFSYYADTVGWIEQHLTGVVEDDHRLADYAGRITSVSSDDSRGGVSRREAIYGFAPESTEAPPADRDDRFDLLISTDVLAEGMNLQQSCHVVNYDLPWNPMRIVQRNGRIDRIGSPYERVYARCFFPDQRLDQLLTLEERIRRKLAQAAASIGVENAPVPEAPTGEQVFADTRDEIARLLAEDPSLLETAGEDPSAHSGEEYRQELRRGLALHGSTLRRLPWAAGSGYVGTGKERGWAFCARIGERVFLRFVFAGEGAVLRDTLQCLRQFTCEEETPRHLAPDLQQGVYEAWQAARHDILDEWLWATDPANLQPTVPRIFRSMADHVRHYPPLTLDQPALDELLDRLEAPWPRRVQNAFRDIYRPDEEPADPRGTSQRIAELVKALGLQPFRQPEPLPPIEEGQVRLVCWMGVEVGGNGEA